jgi:hypothetical protein
VIVAPSVEAENPEDALDVHVFNLDNDSWRRVAN